MLTGMLLVGCSMPQLEAARQAAPAVEQPAGPTMEQPAEPEAVGEVAISGASAVEGDGAMTFTVSVAGVGKTIVVGYATENGSATAGADYGAASGTLTFAGDTGAAQAIEVAVRDDAVAEGSESFRMLVLDAHGARLAAATGTILDDDRRAVVVQPAALNVPEGGSASYAVVLGSQPTDAVRISATVAGGEVSAAPRTLEFGAADWARAQTVTITAREDDDALSEPPVEVVHAVSGGDYGGARAPAVVVTVVEDDAPTLALHAAYAAEGSGELRFVVSLSLAGGEDVRVAYATGAQGDTASAGQDYAEARGVLRFPAHSTAAQTIAVTLYDDGLDEPDEVLTVTLSAAEHALLAGGGETAATGTIEDDDPPPVLSIDDADAAEGAGSMAFDVRLQPASGRVVTVRYATADVTATTRGDDYTAVSGTMTFAAGATARTVLVPIVDDALDEPDERFTVTLRAAVNATVARATAHGTITDDDDPVTPPITTSDPAMLSSLAVTGAGTMYPPFDADTLHYALTCGDDTTVRVTAQATRSTAGLTVLRADEDDEASATGSLDVELTVDADHDIAVELSDGGDTVTYVVHCLPASFPDVTILKKTAGVSNDLLLVVPKVITGLFQNRYKFATVMDNNGVPWFHRSGESGNFRAFGNGPTIDGRQVRYSLTTAEGHALLDETLRVLRTVTISGWDSHDFLITEKGTLLFMGYKTATRDASHITNPEDDTPLSSSQQVRDVIIVERSLAGKTLFEWNSWDHLNVPDCITGGFRERYAQINAFQLVDGDIVASFRNCATVLRIDRSGGTGAVEWQVGGSSANPTTAFRPIVGDDAARNEFCGQHSPSQIGSKLVVFDNGNFCLGPRKDDPVFSRVVEYELSSREARFSREYRRRSGHGYARYEGGVTVLDNGNWLIFWGYPLDYTVAVDALVTISEVNPQGEAVFEMNMSGDGFPVSSYRVYRMPASWFKKPWNLP